MNNQKTYKFSVGGMHCRSCVLLIESELKGIPCITKTTVDLHNQTVEVVGEFGDRNQTEIFDLISPAVKKSGYVLALDKIAKKK